MRLKDVTIKSKLYGMTALSAIAMMVVLGLSIWCLETFRVNGPVYRGIVRDKDVVADILPPPLYIVEPYLLVHEAEQTADLESVRAIEGKVAELEAGYRRRWEAWEAQLPADELKALLLERSAQPAEEFFRVAREEYFPARERGDRTAAKAVLAGKLRDAYERHRLAIDRTVAIAADRARGTEVRTAERVRFWVRTMSVVSVAAVAGLTLAGWLLTRHIVRSADVLIRRVDELAAGGGDGAGERVHIDSRDEIGLLAAGINATIERMRGVIQWSRDAEEEATHLRHLLRNIIDSMPSVLVGVDAEARVMQWNREAERVTGVTAAEAMGRELHAILPQLRPQIGLVSAAVADRTVQRDERVAWDRPDGRHISELTVYPLITNGIRGAVVRIDDVTTRVRLEEMMIQSEKMRSIGALAAGIAHEINNPLAGVLQSAQVVLRRISSDLPANRAAAEECGTTVEAVNAYLGRRGIPAMLEGIHSSCERAADIVTNMLSFSRNSGSQVAPHVLADLVDQAVELDRSDYDLRKRQEVREVEVVCEHDRDLPAVPCRASEVQQVVLNLLKNASQAMAARGRRADAPRIVVRTRGDGNGGACIEVEDNGPGMPETVRSRVFEPFFTTKPPQSGSGLGLFIVYCIVTRNHGGRIDVESAEGRGTRFTVTLPLGKES